MNKNDAFMPAEPDELTRCDWAVRNYIEMEHHDNEWGRPQHDDNKLFEALALEGLSAGINRVTVLYNREDLRTVFDQFNPRIIAKYDQKKINQLIVTAGIVRDRLKIHAVVRNANAFLAIQKEHGSFDKYLWDFVGGKTVRNEWEISEEIPNSTPLAETISLSLQGHGFKFVGPPTVYRFMQLVGLVNDHLTECYLYGAY